MKTSKLFQVVATAGLAGALAFRPLGCSSNGNESSTVEGLTGGVAATVNGTEIQEDTVTTYIQKFPRVRRLYGRRVVGLLDGRAGHGPLYRS